MNNIPKKTLRQCPCKNAKYIKKKISFKICDRILQPNRCTIDVVHAEIDSQYGNRTWFGY